MVKRRAPARLPTLLASVLMAIAVVGCTAAASPGGSPALAPSMTPSPSLTAASPTDTAPTPSATATAATPSPTATAFPSPPPVIDPPSAKPWTRIEWVHGAGGVPVGPANVTAFGWSGGFVAVSSSGGEHDVGTDPFAIVATGSPDGLRWSAPMALDVSGLDGRVQAADLVEGPAGLLLVGYVDSGTCGGPNWVGALWSSSDGVAWTRIPLPKSLSSNRVETLDAGAAGYIATGLRKDGVTAGIWFSKTGASWRSLALPIVSTGIVVVNGATSFDGGLVLAGAVLGPEGCGGAASVHPSLWWSKDGATWTRESFTGGSSARDATMTIRRLSDHAVIAIEESSKLDGLVAWVSTDGRTWQRAGSPPRTIKWSLHTDGRHAVEVVSVEGTGAAIVAAVDERARVTELEQAGDGPVASADPVPWTAALGPTGVLILSVDGRSVWLGVPKG